MPANARIVDFVPMDVLLPSCAAVIHHGGAGTWGAAVLHGVPQIIIGALWDAPLKGQQIDRLGAGISLRPEDLDAATLREAVVRVLEDPSIAEGARKLRAEMRSDPAPADIVPTLERLTARYGHTR